MKKISSLLMCIVTLFCLSGCSLFESNEDTDYGLDPSIPTVEVVTSYSEVYSNIYNSCVGIRNIISSNTSRIGSGVVLKSNDESTYILTNRHVVAAYEESNISNNVSIYFGNNSYVSGSVIASTKYSEHAGADDLAIIQIPSQSRRGVVPVELGDDVLSKGQDVLAVGCPMSLLYYNTLSVGVVSKLHSSDNLVQHNATINPGNSGGGLFNLAGRLIGINVSKLVDENNEDVIEGMNFAIDIAKVRSFLSSVSFEL